MSEILKHSASYWTAQNTVLGLNQQGYEIDTGIYKVGDGVTPWNELSYFETHSEYVTVSGTDTYTADMFLLNVVGYFIGMRLRAKFTNANTGASTIDVNSLGVKGIKKDVASDLASGDIKAGGIYHLVYDGTNFQVVGLGAAGITGSGTLNFVPKWTPNGSTLGDSQIFDNGSFVGINITSPAGSERLRVNGDARIEGTTILVTSAGIWRASGNIDSLNVQARQLLSANGVISIEYGSRVARDSSNIASINWQTRTLAQNAGSNSLDWFNRRLQSLWTCQGLNPQLNNTYDLGNTATPLRYRLLSLIGTIDYDTNLLFHANTVEKARIQSDGKFGILTASPTALLDLNSGTGYNQLRMRASFTPTSTADANGSTGDIAWDASFVYIKTGAGWKRSALSAF